ncbi:hypothetical protein Gohar_026353 [Gossypium harknessii]|uniref:Uncharacterized protein n=1 Tax=Gossypium harknessii TaxID=34285 RepID=A0A7J9HRB0_9ROSI|nr:hypothetical protein [Gossypium harknessii]
MEEELANLNLIDEEEDAFHKEATVVDQNYQFSLIRRCLTDSVVHFPSLRNTIVDLWHPIWGICISNLGEKRLFFFNFSMTLTFKECFLKLYSFSIIIY